MFLFCHTEQRYYDTNAAYGSLNELLSCARAYGTMLTWVPSSLSGTIYTTDGHCRHLVSLPDYSGARVNIRVNRAVEHGKNGYDELARWLVVKNALP